MILDVGTSYIVGAGFVATAGVSVLLLAYRLPADLRSSARAWTLASGTIALSWTLFALDPHLPDLAHVLFGNLFYLIAVTLLYNSVRLFDGLAPRRDLYLTVVLPAILVTLAARYVFDSFDLRVVVMSAAVALFLGLSAHHLLRRRPALVPDDFGRRATAAWLLASVGIFVVRIGVTVLQGGAPPALENGTQQTIALGVALVSVAGLIFSYFLLYIGRATTELQRQADRDPLTGLYNRRAFELHGERQIRLARAQRRSLALLVLDADGFKPINDAWGHDAGDQALRLIADTLQAHLRTQDVLARLGGDEFAVLLPGLDEGGALRLARRLSEAVATCSFAYPVELGVSFGLSMLESDHRDVRSLLVRADEAMYEEKRRRRGAVGEEGGSQRLP